MGGGGSVPGSSTPPTQFRSPMFQVQQTCACGRKYWPNQVWIHEKCGVVNHQETVTVATNGPELVVNRKLDRHNKEARRQYMREYMRKRRGG